MKQRTIMILTTILTAFILVVVGGIVRNVTAGNADVSNSTPSNQEPAYQEPAAPASDQMMVGVTADSATAIALQAQPDGTLTKAPELVNYQGVVAYEILLDRASLYIDANSGEVLYNSAENSAAMGEYEEYEEDEEHEEDDDDGEYEEHEEDDDDEYEESDD